jgi:hypothetical protein
VSRGTRLKAPNSKPQAPGKPQSSSLTRNACRHVDSARHLLVCGFFCERFHSSVINSPSVMRFTSLVPFTPSTCKLGEPKKRRRNRRTLHHREFVLWRTKRKRAWGSISSATSWSAATPVRLGLLRRFGFTPVRIAGAVGLSRDRGSAVIQQFSKDHWQDANAT